jgi:hypothetical protein
MTLYLQATVGRTSYLIVATRVTDVQPADGAAVESADDALPVIDCRTLFGEPAANAGCQIQCLDEAGAPLRLIVDRLDGLRELGADAFRPLPPIGRYGELIDAVAVPGPAEAPALRLHLGSALIAARGV